MNLDLGGTMLLKKGNERIVNNVVGINAHDVIRMGIVLDKLDGKLVYVVELEMIKEAPNILHIREGISTAIADENGEVMWNVREVIYWGIDFSIVHQVVVYGPIVEFGQYPGSSNFSNPIKTT